MRTLVDTHALIWWWTSDERALSSKAISLFRDPETEIVVSAASAWEIATKHRLGKLPELPDPPRNFPIFMARSGFTPFAIGEAHGLRAGSFAAGHGDPFDRMLAAQAIIEGIPILSLDAALDQFGCERIWE